MSKESAFFRTSSFNISQSRPRLSPLLEHPALDEGFTRCRSMVQVIGNDPTYLFGREVFFFSRRRHFGKRQSVFPTSSAVSPSSNLAAFGFYRALPLLPNSRPLLPPHIFFLEMHQRALGRIPPVPYSLHMCCVIRSLDCLCHFSVALRYQ